MITKNKYLNWKTRYLEKGINKIGIVDIETHGFGFNANQSFVISWGLKIIDLRKNKHRMIYDVIDKKTIKYWNRKMKKNKKLQIMLPYDTELLKGLVAELSKCDLIIGHYSDYFDIPMIRTRCTMLRIPFLKYTSHVRFGDTWKKARFGMKFIRNSLDMIGRTLGLNITNSRFDVFQWVLGARYGDRNALKLIVDHNIKDVEITYKIWKYTESNFAIPAKYY